MAARTGRITMLANVALALEYKAICTRTGQVVTAGLSSADAEIFITAVVAMAEPVESHFI
jgi:hypothetical protein